VNPDGPKLSKRDSAVSLPAGPDLAQRGGALLLAALRFLGQLPPLSFYGAPCAEILSWAVAHLNPDLIPQASAPLTIND